METMKLVLIEWKDACSSYHWEHRDDPTHILPSVSGGILVRENEEEIEVALTITLCSKNNSVAIPKACIKRMRKLHI